MHDARSSAPIDMAMVPPGCDVERSVVHAVKGISTCTRHSIAHPPYAMRAAMEQRHPDDQGAAAHAYSPVYCGVADLPSARDAPCVH